MNEPKTVAEAARQLDAIDTMWFNKINLSYLDMENPCRCIFGQVFGNEDEDFYDIFYKLYGREWRYAHEQIGLYNVFCSESTEEWVRELNRRQARRYTP
jgi:hypothetical protein